MGACLLPGLGVRPEQHISHLLEVVGLRKVQTGHAHWAAMQCVFLSTSPTTAIAIAGASSAFSSAHSRSRFLWVKVLDVVKRSSGTSSGTSSEMDSDMISNTTEMGLKFREQFTNVLKYRDDFRDEFRDEFGDGFRGFKVECGDKIIM